MSDVEIIDFLVRHGVLRDVVRCARCGNEIQLNRQTLQFRCQRSVSVQKKAAKKCGFKMSARIGTFFENSHLTLRQVFDFVNILVWLKPPRQDHLRLNVGLSSRSVVDWYSFCREVFVDHSLKVSEVLGGPGCVVEIDEAKFGKRKYNRGRRVEGQWVFGGVERGTGKSFMVPVERRDSKTLLAILEKWVLPETTVYSDCWKAYDSLGAQGFTHLTVNHSYHFKDPETGCHTNTVERAWREARSTVPRFGVRKGHFVGYLAEFMFKRRYPTKTERLHQFFAAAAALYPPPQ